VNCKAKTRSVAYRNRFYSNSLSFLAWAKSLMNIHNEKFSRARIASRTAQVLPLPTKDSRVLPMSSFARQSMKRISLSEVARKRRCDFQYWQEVTRGNPLLRPIFGQLPEGVCPLGFGLRAKDRDSLIARARKKGIQLRVHWRLDSELGIECRTSHTLSREMLTLPLYPELEPKEREVLAGIVTGQ
jgi:hypothetical protein